MKIFLAFPVVALLAFNANADVCPKEGEPIAMTPYQMSRACPAATVLVKGERNPEEYESCLGDVPFAKEQVSYVSKDKKQLPLPTVSSLLPVGNDFRGRPWFVGDLGPTNI